MSDMDHAWKRGDKDCVCERVSDVSHVECISRRYQRMWADKSTPFSTREDFLATAK